MAIENDWKYDFSSLPRWDVRDRIPFVYDKFHSLPQCDALCCIYSIAEVRMCWNQGFLAILKNKEAPKLVLNINEELTFSDNFSASKKGDVIFLLSHFYDKTTTGVGNLLLIVDIAREKFSYLKINNHNPCYKVVELNDGVFGIEADEFQRSGDEQFDAFSKTIIKLDCLDWYSFEDINKLSEIV
jgi:hypothetical protein